MKKEERNKRRVVRPVLSPDLITRGGKKRREEEKPFTPKRHIGKKKGEGGGRKEARPQQTFMGRKRKEKETWAPNFFLYPACKERGKKVGFVYLPSAGGKKRDIRCGQAVSSLRRAFTEGGKKKRGKTVALVFFIRLSEGERGKRKRGAEP